MKFLSHKENYQMRNLFEVTMISSIIRVVSILSKFDQCDENNPVIINQKPKPEWNKASNDQKLEYDDLLFKKLRSLEIPDFIVKM